MMEDSKFKIWVIWGIWGHSRSSAMSPFDSKHYFLLAFRTNFVSIFRDIASYLYQFLFVTQAAKQANTRMWANAQRDGRPAEYRWRRLFNAAV